MKPTLLLIALTTISLNATAKSQHQYSRITLNSNESIQVFKALQLTGVVDEAQMLGAVTLIARSIECRIPEASNSMTNCRVITSSGTLNMPSAEAANVAPILASHQPRTQHYKAYNIACVEVVVPGSIPACSFTTVAK